MGRHDLARVVVPTLWRRPQAGDPVSTDLERFRDHAAAMAKPGAHRDTCHVEKPMRWGPPRTVHPDPACTGCVPPADRALFARLATEVDQHLDPPPAAHLDRALCDPIPHHEIPPSCINAPDCIADEHIFACPAPALRDQGDHP